MRSTGQAYLCAHSALRSVVESALHYRLDSMGECALLVSLGAEVSESVSVRVHALARTVRQANIRGLVELVPAYASLLLVFEPELCTGEWLAEEVHLLMAEPDRAEAAQSRIMEVPVVYGGAWGPDIDEVAAAHSLSSQEVVSLHTAPLYRVHFLGFMPGFAYMGGLHAKLATPRLPTPRVRVPAGSVGVAGGQTGVYPLDSPGGWRIIGRTPLQMWDVQREPPALLAAGDLVKFVATEGDVSLSVVHPYAQTLNTRGGLDTLEVLSAGGISTVQDLGRRGYAGVGLSGGGAMDPDALVLANRLVGNEDSAAALELTWSGPTLRAVRTTVVAVTGADLGCTVDGIAAPPCMSWLVRTGSVIEFRRGAGEAGGLRSYLAVAGGLDVPVVLGSRATYIPAGFGGYRGRALRVGDRLATLPARRSPLELAGRICTGAQPRLAGSPAVLRFIRYKGQGAGPGEAVDRMLETEFVVSPSSDRMGIRLEPLRDLRVQAGGGEVLSFGVVRGAIQLPPGGAAVVLDADHQTTGGYPVAGVVARVDWQTVSALMPGQSVSFQEISIGDARTAYAESRRGLECLV